MKKPTQIIPANIALSSNFRTADRFFPDQKLTRGWATPMSLNLCFQAQCCLHTARSCFSMWNFSGRHTLTLDAHTGSCVICWNHLAFCGFAVSVRRTVWKHRAQTQSPWFRSDTYRCLWSFGQTGSCRIKHLIRWLKLITDSKGSWARSLLLLRKF